MSNLKKIEGGVTTPQGFTAGAVYTAIKKRENKKPDVGATVKRINESTGQTEIISEDTYDAAAQIVYVGVQRRD